MAMQSSMRPIHHADSANSSRTSACSQSAASTSSRSNASTQAYWESASLAWSSRLLGAATVPPGGASCQVWGSRRGGTLALHAVDDPQRDRAHVAVAVLRERRRRLRAAIPIDAVLRIGRASARAGVVGRCREDGVAGVFVEEQLGGVDLVPTLVRLEMDVDGAPLVPAGIDGAEGHRACVVGGLDAAEERRIRGGGAEPGVVAGGVGVPDLHRRARDGP